MRRLLALALLLAAPLAAQDAAYKLTQVAVRLDGGAGGAGFSTPASCTTAGMVPIFLGSPVALGCDAGLTYDAATDTLTVALGSVTTSIDGNGINSAAWDMGLYGGRLGFGAGGRVTWGTGWNGTPDSGLARASAGVLKVTDGSTGAGKIQAGGVQFLTGSRPTCDAAARGMVWYVAGGGGAADTCEICRKDSADNYAWVTIF